IRRDGGANHQRRERKPIFVRRCGDATKRRDAVARSGRIRRDGGHPEPPRASGASVGAAWVTRSPLLFLSPPVRERPGGKIAWRRGAAWLHCDHGRTTLEGQ